MKTIKALLGGLLLAATSLSYATSCPTTDVISDPDEFQWVWQGDHYSGTLVIGEETFNIGNDTITTRAYGQEGGPLTIPGPTIKMKPGFKYVLRFKNTLPYEVKNPDHNIFKDPNVSNLHTHGLHISGMTPGDDVTRSFEGGRGGDFVYDIPADHMGGTFWYHAHHHGSTYLQVSGGAFGLMIIDDVDDTIPDTVRAMQEKQLVIAYLDPGVAGTGGDTLITGTLSPTWTVNGGVGGTMCQPANTWHHWRVLLADRDAKPKTVTVGQECEVALMARDGVWRTTVPKALGNNAISLTGASRADLAVRCSADSTISVGGTLVANVHVDGVADSGPTPYDADDPNNVTTWDSDRPAYLRDLRGPISVHTETIRLGARTVNGRKFNADLANIELGANEVQEWSLVGALKHPFHLHIYHVQVQGDCGDFEDGEYYDVVSGNCTIRFDLNSTDSSIYEGRTIMHCHILQHEDQGAMGWLNVLGNGNSIGKPLFPETTPASEVIQYGNYYEHGGTTLPDPPLAPIGLSAIADSSSAISLSWGHTSPPDEDGFNVERSDDAGQNYSEIGQAVINATSYTDSGLTASTDYSYRINAYNAGGPSTYSDPASATTLAGEDPTSMQVSSVVLSSPGIGQGRKIGRATVIITDDQGGSVVGVTVSGDFTGDLTESGSTADSDGSGTAVIDTSGSKKGKFTLTFCVTSVTGGTLPDLAFSPGDKCDSL